MLNLIAATTAAAASAGSVLMPEEGTKAAMESGGAVLRKLLLKIVEQLSKLWSKSLTRPFLSFLNISIRTFLGIIIYILQSEYISHPLITKIHFTTYFKFETNNNFMVQLYFKFFSQVSSDPQIRSTSLSEMPSSLDWRIMLKKSSNISVLMKVPSSRLSVGFGCMVGLTSKSRELFSFLSEVTAEASRALCKRPAAFTCALLIKLRNLTYFITWMPKSNQMKEEK